MDFKSLDEDGHCQRLEKSIELANWAVETAFRDTLTRIVESVHESLALQQELVLRRALKAVERFENVAKRPGLVDGAQKTHSKILRQLIAITQAQDDVVEVTHFQGELSILDGLGEGQVDTYLNEGLARSLRNSAGLAYEVLWTLNMPAEVRNTLAFTQQTLCPAHRAMHAGFEEAAKALLFERSDVASLHLEALNRSHVHIAVETGSLKLLLPLIEQNPSLLNSRDALGRTPLLIAAAMSDLAAYDILVNAGAEIWAGDMATRCVLSHACASGSFEIVQKSLKGGADIDGDIFGVLSPLCAAASRGHYEICLLLLEHRDCADQLMKAAELAENNGHYNVAALLRSKSGTSLSGHLFHHHPTYSDLHIAQRITEDYDIRLSTRQVKRIHLQNSWLRRHNNLAFNEAQATPIRPQKHRTSERAGHVMCQPWTPSESLLRRGSSLFGKRPQNRPPEIGPKNWSLFDVRIMT